MDIHSLEAAFIRYQFRSNGAGRLRLWGKLAKLLRSNVPIKKALESIYERRLRMSKSDVTAKAVADWLEQMNNGIRFSEAIVGWVDANERMLLSAGEQSGTLSGALESSVLLMKSKKAIRSAIIGGTAYPMILLLMSFGILMLFGYLVIPAFSKVVGDDKWTGAALAMIQISHFVQHWLWLVGVMTVALFVAFIWSLPRWDGKYRVLADKYIPYSIFRMVEGATWMIALSAMVDAGIRLENALEEMAERAYPWLENRIRACLTGMRSGKNPGESLIESGMGFPDPEILDDISVYSALSGFEEALSRIGREWLEDGVDRIKGVMNALFAIFVVLVGVIIASMVGGMFAMQIQLTQILKSMSH